MIKNIGIVDFGAGNLFAIYNGCLKIGLKPSIINKENENFSKFDSIIIPGVGSFSSAMMKIIDLGFHEKIIDFKKSGKLVLGICLGMQLLTTKSYEGKITNGFNFVDAEVTSIINDLKNFIPKNKIRVPLTGWNSVYFEKEKNEGKFLKNINFEYQHFYFIHSYWIKNINDEFWIGNSFYMNKNFCSCFKKENIVGVQFHPERSGEKGLNFLKEIFKFYD